jgi:hypothetical protein
MVLLLVAAASNHTLWQPCQDNICCSGVCMQWQLRGMQSWTPLLHGICMALLTMVGSIDHDQNADLEAPANINRITLGDCLYPRTNGDSRRQRS